MLVSLAMRGFRCCVDTALDFGSEVVALVGHNGAGKTTILRALDVLADLSRSPDLRSSSSWLPFDRSEFVLAFQIDGNIYRLEVVSTVSLREATVDRQWGESLTLVSPDRESRLVFSRKDNALTLGNGKTLSIGPGASSIFALQSLLPTSDSVREELDPAASFLRGISYYSLGVREDRADIVLSTDYRNWIERFESGGNPGESIAYRILYMSERDPELFEEFKHLLGPHGLGLIDEISISVDPAEAKGESGKQFYFVQFRLGRELGGAGSWQFFSNLSTGTKRVLQLLALLLFDKRRVILLEQPEDSIHPGLLRKLIDILRSYADKTQVVFSSHSSDVLNLLEPDQVRLVRAADGNTQVRSLNRTEIEAAREYMREEGLLSEFFESIEEV